MVVVSIIGTDRFVGGYGAAKIAHEQVPTRNLVDMAELLVARRGRTLRIQAVSDAADPNRGSTSRADCYPVHAMLAEPTFEAWPDATSRRFEWGSRPRRGAARARCGRKRERHLADRRGERDGTG
ncbi:MAG: hypothetical protein QOI08_1769, partial [Actinomycetota bacterium]|nr:hypothetical protein [Actinomycetota bacterium]